MNGSRVNCQVFLLCELFAALGTDWRMAFVVMIYHFLIGSKLKRLFRDGNNTSFSWNCLHLGSRCWAHVTVVHMLLAILSMGIDHMPSKPSLGLKCLGATFASLLVGLGAWKRVACHVLDSDMLIERLLLSEQLFTWRIIGAVKLVFVNFHVPLKLSSVGKALFAPIPVTREALDVRRRVSVLHMSFKVIFATKGLIAIFIRTGKGTFIVMELLMLF